MKDLPSLVSTARGLAILGLGLAIVTPAARAIPITVDTYLADVVGQTASIDMTVSGSTLTITFKNLTGVLGPTGADGLLTGLAFDLPNTIDIVLAGSDVAVGSGSFIRGGTLNGLGSGTSLKGEWGYTNGVSGHFNGLAVDTQVSTMEADVATVFSGGSIDNPKSLAGPDFGIMRTSGDPGGLTAIENGVTITLTLSQSVAAGGEAAFISAIDAGKVAVTFGSPSSSSVPEGGTTLAFLGLAVGSLGFIRLKIK